MLNIKRSFIAHIAAYTFLVSTFYFIYNFSTYTPGEKEYIFHEAFVLFVFSVLYPIIVLLRMDDSYSPKAKFFRVILFCGVGVFAADFVLPEAYKYIISYLHYAKLVTVIPGLIVEIIAVFAIYKIALSRSSTIESAAAIEKEYGVPPWLARAFVADAKFWRTVYRFLFHTKD